jgi:hypothetical protein
MAAAKVVRALVHKLAAPVEHELDRGRVRAFTVLVLAQFTVHGPYCLTGVARGSSRLERNSLQTADS